MIADALQSANLQNARAPHLLAHCLDLRHHLAVLAVHFPTVFLCPQAGCMQQARAHLLTRPAHLHQLAYFKVHLHQLAYFKVVAAELPSRLASLNGTSTDAIAAVGIAVTHADV